MALLQAGARAFDKVQLVGGTKPLTVAEFCTELEISRSTFYDWRAKRRAPKCITLPNGSLRIRRAEYERWLASRKDAA
ncbi:helix-turn-helix domain-containing protein [Streptosporangium canum]|uniref:helix-turn-helix transcriptional regulator n=1 Tax=Streptosporangium canum TaxID=324952 RepID=UPI0034199148